MAASVAMASLACGSRSGLDAAGPGIPEAQPLALAPPPAALPTDEPPLLTDEPLRAPAMTGCVDITRSYTSVPATVMLLIDQSGSMDLRFGPLGTRWDILREAIVEPETGLLAWLDQSAEVGLMLYTSLDGFEGGGACPMITRVDVQVGSVEKVRGAYLAEEPEPEGDTPTGEGIDQAVIQLARVGGAAPKYILLLTDGAPDTCAQPDPQNGMPQAIDAAERAFAQGIRVITVGVSQELSGQNLQRMANAGAGKPPELRYGQDADAEPPLSANNDPRQLADQLKGVIGDVRTCNIELGTEVGLGRGLEGRLSLDGEALDYDNGDGWSFVDDDTLLIHGAACEKILADGERLEVRFPCISAPPSPR